MGFKLAVRTNVVVNTKRTKSVDDMPPEAHRLFESVLANLPHGSDALHLAPTAPRPDPALQAIEPGGVPKWLIAAMVAAGLLLALLLQGRG